MSVTEDHRFWSVTDTDWVELQDLDTDDILLTPDGATATVNYLDWDAGITAPAFDLTVADEHNFFVAADVAAEPVLVHNMDRLSLGCRFGFGVDATRRIANAEAAIGDGVLLSRLDDVLDDLAKLSKADDFYEELAAVTDEAQLRRILQNAALGEDVVVAALGTGRLPRILGHPRFAAAAASTTVDNLALRIATRQDLTPATIATVRNNDAVFGDLAIADDDIIDAWWVYRGSKSQDAWLTAYVQVRKNGQAGSQFEVDALTAALVSSASARKILFDFSAIPNPGTLRIGPASSQMMPERWWMVGGSSRRLRMSVGR